ncbi:MAG: hypothetical protein A2315_14250 [Ignavibacteria bacterium RIFOXYB2_FULL_35_12]|nr:MAG: hypothetical protein A2455_01575 [Ignavibacteria bacterium RIFOXYC2_FULL_35_16]OGV02250.1 MAG: hypothetical protein A2315_14250 [Ignavibacteria bacterium RIFOXYB2_FULL_35_12]
MNTNLMFNKVIRFFGVGGWLVTKVNYSFSLTELGRFSEAIFHFVTCSYKQLAPNGADKNCSAYGGIKFSSEGTDCL